MSCSHKQLSQLWPRFSCAQNHRSIRSFEVISLGAIHVSMALLPDAIYRSIDLPIIHHCTSFGSLDEKCTGQSGLRGFSHLVSGVVCPESTLSSFISRLTSNTPKPEYLATVNGITAYTGCYARSIQ